MRVLYFASWGVIYMCTQHVSHLRWLKGLTCPSLANSLTRWRVEKVTLEGNCIHRPNSSPSFTSATVCESITRLGLYLINMSCQMLVVSCVISRSACTRKYRDASESSGREEGRGKEKELRGERGGREWYRKPCTKQFVQRVYIYMYTVKEKLF